MNRNSNPSAATESGQSTVEDCVKVLSIGYGRHLFKDSDSERKRMETCSRAVDSYDMIIFTYASDNLETVYTSADTGLALHPTNSTTKLGMIFDAFMLARKIIKTSNETIYVTTQDPFETGFIGLVLKWCYGVYLTVQEHGDVYSRNFWKHESFVNLIRHSVGLFVLKRADTVRVVSERILETLSRKGIDKNRITKLPVAIDLANFTAVRPDVEMSKVFHTDSFVFLSVARFVPQKNLTLLIESFFNAYQINPLIRLLIVGSGPEEALMRDMILKFFPNKNEGVCPIEILPWSDNVPGLMAVSDAYVLSSNYEGWARVLIESMCVGLPIVTTDVGCAREVVKDRECGFVVPVASSESLVDRLVTISTDEVVYSKFRENLQNLSKDKLPGTSYVSYGKDWSSSLVCKKDRERHHAG